MNIHHSKNKFPPGHISEAQLLGYKAGTLPDAEMHQVEMHLLECDLCSDALEGALLAENHQIKADVSQIKNALHQKFSSKKSRQPKWMWVAAASVGLIILISYQALYFKFTENPEVAREVSSDHSVAQKEENTVAEAFPDSLKERDPIALYVPEENMQVERRARKDSPSSAPPDAPQSKPLMEESIVYISDEEVVVFMESETFPVYEESVEEKLMSHDKDLAKSVAPLPTEDSRQASGTSLLAKKEKISAIKELKGKVVDESGEPLPGVNVMVKGTNRGTLTDIDGNFEIEIAPGDQKVVYSYIGYINLESEIGDMSQVVVTMSPDMMALSEVVITGYGTRAAEIESKSLPKPSISMRKYRQYIKENLKYPAGAAENNVEGNVILQFVVNPGGPISDIAVISPIGFGIDDEAIRLIKEGPSWEPATVNGTPVPEKVRLKIPFKLKK